MSVKTMGNGMTNSLVFKFVIHIISLILRLSFFINFILTQELTRICEHPLVDMALAGEARQHIPSSFHTLLQTIADLMLIFPTGSPLQQMAIKCWGFQFTQSDYNFLHRYVKTFLFMIFKNC